MIKSVGENIRLLRHRKGFSQEYVARQLNISVPPISKIETGATDITLSRLEQIAAALDVTVKQLLSFDETEKTGKSADLELLNEKLFRRELEMVDLQKKVIMLFEELHQGKAIA